jgi:hypothetical protein
VLGPRSERLQRALYLLKPDAVRGETLENKKRLSKTCLPFSCADFNLSPRTASRLYFLRSICHPQVPSIQCASRRGALTLFKRRGNQYNPDVSIDFCKKDTSGCTDLD